ncbi:glycerophosphodiester phosphodiesterase family protein [Fulvivirga sp. M361]|uniref:glycerophosphodiester phosphodiesterase family protein n=1 Tax=Fulvivirga sp. M361 TaxID=2594266 RepID=UPI00117A602B|nr:glycerophosphodiester phosphodiesterase family protein [Fulvivirga sp. M361]TRX60766.1 glycerophosphodiester phosphodiesterase family protein [Fulvivirga sp. M361]
MKNRFKFSPLLLLICIHFGCGTGANNKADNALEPTSTRVYAKSLSDIRAALMDANSDQVMVIAHRGDWRHAPENSIPAITNCIEMGIEMVEIDIRMTKDSVLVLMHDDTIDRTTTGAGLLSEWTLDSIKTLYLRNGVNHPTHHKVPTLEEAMLEAKGKIMINLDKCYSYFDKAYDVLERTGTIDHVIMKGKVPVEKVKQEFGEYLGQVFFMPIVDLNHPDAVKTIRDYQEELKPVAYELIFEDESSDVLNQFPKIRQQGSRVWVNSLWESLNAGYEDDRAVEDPEGIYGWYEKRKVNMIQTDRPRLLLDYLRKRKLHD